MGSRIPDLDKIMQRFNRKPLRVNLTTLLGVYRAVMRLTSVRDALDEAIEQDGTDSEGGRTRTDGLKNEQTAHPHVGADTGVVELADGARLLRQFVVGPLQKVWFARK